MAHSYDRVAHIYDETRGGVERGRRYAREIDQLLTEGTAVEIGIGTGSVAAGLVELGRRVVGFDIGALMLEHAMARLGPRIARADATCMPFADRSIASMYAVWVLHAVDGSAVMGEVARVLREGGRFVACPTVVPERDVITDVVTPMYEALLGTAPRRDPQELLTGYAEGAGLKLVEARDGAPQRFTGSPGIEAIRLEERQGAALWDIEDETWERVVVPTIRALRALPDEEIERTSIPRILVFGRT